MWACDGQRGPHGQRFVVGGIALAVLLTLSNTLALAGPTPPSAVILPHWSPPVVAIVFPHDASGKPTAAADSTEVNVSVWPANQVRCSANPGLSLWIAYNNDPGGALTVPIEGELIQRRVGAVTFPSLEFNNVPLNLAANPSARFSIMAASGGPGGNVWVHAADARTYSPQPVVPVGYGNPFCSGCFDGRIQIVFPHDRNGREAPVAQATLLNIGADIFLHGSQQSVPPDFQFDTFDLLVAEGNGPLAGAKVSSRPQRVTYAANGQIFPRWVFNDVPVDPGRQYHFAAFVYRGKISSPYSNVWTHAADARTTLPAPEVPPPCVP